MNTPFCPVSIYLFASSNKQAPGCQKITSSTSLLAGRPGIHATGSLSRSSLSLSFSRRFPFEINGRGGPFFPGCLLSLSSLGTRACARAGKSLRLHSLSDSFTTFRAAEPDGETRVISRSNRAPFYLIKEPRRMCVYICRRWKDMCARLVL